MYLKLRTNNYTAIVNRDELELPFGQERAFLANLIKKASPSVKLIKFKGTMKAIGVSKGRDTVGASFINGEAETSKPVKSDKHIQEALKETYEPKN